MKHRLISNTISLTFIQVANYVAPLILLVHLASVLGPETYGILAFGQAIIVMSGILIDFGYSLSATDKISRYRRRSSYVSMIIGGIYVFKLFLFLCCAIVVWLFANFSQAYADHKFFLLLTLLPVFFQSFFPLWFFQGLEKMQFLAFFSVVIKVLYVCLVVFFVKVPEDYILVPIFNAFSQSVGISLSIWMIYRLGYRIIMPNRKILFHCIRFSQQFFISRVAVMVYMNSSVLVLGLVASPAVVATYSIAEQLYKAMQSAISPLSSAVYPFMSKEKDIKLMIKLIYGCVLLVFVGAIIGYFVSPYLLGLFFDESWKSSLSILNVFFIAVVIHAAAVMAGYPLAASVGRLDVANSSVVTGALIYCLGIVGLLLTSGITPIMLAFLMIASELGVLIHRSWILLPLAKIKSQAPI